MPYTKVASNYHHHITIPLCTPQGQLPRYSTLQTLVKERPTILLYSSNPQFEPHLEQLLCENQSFLHGIRPWYHRYYYYPVNEQ